jgi:ankyrin repeat protein
MDAEHNELLLDPITGDLLDDPVTLPCGHTYSRVSLIECFKHQPNICPVCRSVSSAIVFNPEIAPKNITIAHLVDVEKNKNIQQEVLPDKEQNLFSGKLFVLNRESDQIPITRTIAKLEISCSSKKISGGKTLLLLAVDKSGSMAGSPINQCKSALQQILQKTKTNDTIITHILAYDTRCYHITDPNTLVGSGGNDFRETFNGLVEACKLYLTKINNIIILFLTDGQDGNSQSQKLWMDEFKGKMNDIWGEKSWTVHSVGFGGAHDFNFLMNIKTLGKTEGVYRYADPSDSDSEILSNKINSVANTILESCSAPLDVILDNDSVLKLDMKNQKAVIWLHNKPTQAIISLLDHKYIIPIEIVETCDQNLWIQWYGNLTDELINETIQFNNEKEKYSKEDYEVYTELLNNRGKSILKFLSQPTTYELTEDPAPVISRLQITLQNIKQIGSGEIIDKMKLNDLKYEGQCVTKKSNQSQSSNINITIKPAYVPPAQPERPYYYNRPVLYKYRRERRYNGGNMHLIITHGTKSDIDGISSLQASQTDKSGNTVLSLAALVGRCYAVASLLKQDDNIINNVNNYGETALDLALLYGYYKSAEVLLQYGAKSNLDTKMILLTCLDKKYLKTADLIVKHKIAKVEKEMSWYYTDGNIISWIMANVESDIATRQLLTIQKGLFENIDCLESLEKYSFKSFPEILQKSTPGHLAIVQYLLENKKADACEIWDIVTTRIDGNGNINDITFPLFIACEKGNYSMVELLLPYAKIMINKQTILGTTCLWIACSNKHIDVIMLLLDNGADPNICNVKGDSPLYWAAQKGYPMVATILLEHGIDITLANKNRDNVVLISCRCGQEQILRMILDKYVSMGKLEEIFNHYADIDGFNPMIASAEASATNCIETLHKFGADIECRTANDNKIIQYATPLHVAVFYGKLRAVETLHRLGADLNSVTLQGKTALHLAIENKHTEVVRFLLSHNVNTNIPDNIGKLPQYYATVKGNEDIFNEFFNNPLQNYLIRAIYSDKSQEHLKEILLQHGESLGCYEYNDILNIMDSRGLSLLTLAILKKDVAMEQILLKMGGGIVLDKKDDCGLSPNFWKVLMSGEATEDKTITHVRNVIGSEIQNKVLLDLNYMKKSKQDSIINHNCDLETRMIIGYNNKTQNIAKKLACAKNMKHSLLGFMDKINKVVTCNSQLLSELLFDAKVHVISKIATSNSPSTELVNYQQVKPCNMFALYLFTMDDSICQQVNSKLGTLDNNDIMTTYIYCLYQSLYNLPIYPKECYRKINEIFYQPIGTVIEWNSFGIATGKWGNLITDNKSTIFIIKGKTGRDISEYSRYGQNNEIVFLPGCKFVVTDYYVNNITVFGQENIRKTSFKATEINIQKAIEGKAGIIVELEEMIE